MRYLLLFIMFQICKTVDLRLRNQLQIKHTFKCI